MFLLALEDGDQQTPGLGFLLSGRKFQQQGSLLNQG